MFTCFICKLPHRSSPLLCQHLRLQHGLYPGKTLRLNCGQLGCSSSFCTFSGLKKHLNCSHRDVVSSDVVDNVDIQREVDEPLTSQFVSLDSPATTQASVGFSPVLSMCGSVVAQLQASGVAESTVQSVVESMEILVDDINNQARQAVLDCSSEMHDVDLANKVENCFDQLQNPFSVLNTRFKRQKYFEGKWEIVEPVEYVLGVRFDMRRDQTGVYSQIPVTDKFVYVPILGTLKSIFKNAELCEAFLQAKQHEEGIYRDICDGSYFKSNSLFSQEKHALQIQLYFDEFETANPLGSKKGTWLHLLCI